jgi:TPR repeat protein
LGLGRAYYNGVGVERNIEQAKKYFEAAHAYDLPQASIYLGIMYYSGTGVERNVARAKILFERAAAAEYCYAYFMLARIAFREGRLFKGISTWIKGWRLGKKIADKDVTDPRLLGIED